MTNSTFTGPLASGKLDQTVPTTSLDPSFRQGLVVLRQRRTVTFADANTTVQCGVIPLSSQILDVYTDVTTGFVPAAGASIDRLNVGLGATANQIVGSTGGTGPVAISSAVHRVLANDATVAQFANCLSSASNDVNWTITLTNLNTSGVTVAPTQGSATVTIMYVQTV